MPVTTNRFLSTVAAIVVAVAAWITNRYFGDDPGTTELIFVIAMAIEGLLIPAAAAPVGTIDALSGKDR